MTDISPESVESTPRYSLRALFLIAVIFVVGAPAFWLRTESRQSEMTAAYENAGLYREIYPSVHYGFGRLRAGEVPLWNPRQLCGTPFHSNPAHGLFQPLNVVFALLPTERALAVHAFLCLSLMGTFAALLARSFGAGYVAAMLCGVGYAFCGASSAAMSRPALAACLAWAPLTLWGLREYGRTFRAAAAIVTAVALALLVLSGANSAVMAFITVLTPYAILVVLFPGAKTAPRLLSRIEGLVAIAAGGLALSAVQWMPTLAWALTLDQPLRAVLRFDLPGVLPTSFEDLVGQLLVPRPGTLPRVAYLGALVLPVIPAVLVGRGHRWEALYFLVAAVFSLSLGAGGNAWLPSGFPAGAFLLPGMLCLALLVGLGFDRLLVSGESAHRPRVWLPAVVTLAAMGALFYLTVSEPRGRIVVLLFVLIPVLVVRRRWMSAIGGTVLALLLYMDLTAASVNMYRHPLSDAPGCFHRYPSTLRTMEEQALGARVLTSSPVLDFGLPANVGMLFPFIYAAGGEMPLTKEQAVWWRRLGPSGVATATTGPAAATVAEAVPAAANPKLLDYMAVRVLAAAPASAMYAGTWANPRPTFQELRTEDSARLFFNGSALPRALWTPAWRTAEGVASAADLLASAAFDGTLECVIDRDSEGYAELAALVPGPRAEAAPPEPVAGASCVITEDLPERVVLHVSAPCAGVAVLADTYAPGWKAHINGIQCPILRANGLFRGVAVPAGESDIVFEYQPLPYLAGLALSLIAAAFFSLAGLISLVRR